MFRFYEANPQAKPFNEYVAWHLENGFVFSTPEFFAMGRCVDSKRFDPEELEIFPRERSDAWYVFAMAGKMPRLWSIMPWPLPLIGWERMRGGKRELSFFRSEVLHRLCPPENTLSQSN